MDSQWKQLKRFIESLNGKASMIISIILIRFPLAEGRTEITKRFETSKVKFKTSRKVKTWTRDSIYYYPNEVAIQTLALLQSKNPEVTMRDLCLDSNGEPHHLFTDRSKMMDETREYICSDFCDPKPESWVTWVKMEVHIDNIDILLNPENQAIMREWHENPPNENITPSSNQTSDCKDIPATL